MWLPEIRRTQNIMPLNILVLKWKNMFLNCTKSCFKFNSFDSIKFIRRNIDTSRLIILLKECVYSEQISFVRLYWEITSNSQDNSTNAKVFFNYFHTLKPCIFHRYMQAQLVIQFIYRIKWWSGTCILQNKILLE